MIQDISKHTPFKDGSQYLIRKEDIKAQKEQGRRYKETQSEMVKKEIGRYCALNEAERKGIEKGLQQGLQQGIEQGLQQGIIKMAKSLLDILDDTTISVKTGLDIEEVKKLREEEINK